MILADFVKGDSRIIYFFAEGDGISRFSSGKPGKMYPEYPVNPV